MKNLVKIFIFLCSVNIHAQKVDMDKNSMAIKHSFFPSSSVLSPFKTYQARISEPVGFLSYYGLNRVLLIQNLVNIGGYRKVETNGDFTLDIILDALQYGENRTITNSKKDKAGKVTNSYQFKISIYIPITYRILDASQKIIATKEVRNAKNLVEWNSNVYSNTRDLYNYMDANRSQVLSSLAGQYLDAAFREISSKLTVEYGFREDKDWVVFYELDSKSHPEYESYKKNIAFMEKEFKTYKPGMEVAEARKRMQPTIDYFASLPPKLSKEDKHQYELLKHTLINLIYLNFYTDDFVGYKKYNEMLGAIEGKSYWVESRLKNAEDIYKQMIACGASSLYSIRDQNTKIENTIAAPIVEEKKSLFPESKSTTQEIDLSRLKRNPTDRVVPGSYFGLDSVETKGYFVIGPGDDERYILNGPLQNTFFVYLDAKGTANTKPLYPKKIKSFSIDNHQFTVIDYKPAVLFAKKRPCIMEILAELPSIKLYKYYPEDGNAETSDDYAFVFIKTNDESLISFSGSDLFWKKKAREFFKPCQSVIDEIDKLKYFSPTKTISISWADLYQKCSKEIKN